MLIICSLFPLFSVNPVLYEKAWLLNGFSVITALDRVNIYHTIIPVLVNLFAIVIMYWAYAIYNRQNALPLSESGFLFRFSYHEWYFDKLYQKIVVAPVLALGHFARWFDRNIIDGFIHLLAKIGLVGSKVAAWCDRYVIDGILHLLASITLRIGNFARRFQNGKVQYYLFSMLAIILAIFIFKILI